MKSCPIGNQLKRLPGQWLREQNDEAYDKEIIMPLLIAAIGVLIFALEAIHVFFDMRPSLLGSGIVAALGIGYAVIKIRKGLVERENRRKGEEGERIVAQVIERDLIPNGYTVFHDIQLDRDGRKFNIDHLLIGDNGVFAIETKNFTAKGNNSTVSWAGDQILWSGKAYPKNAAGQAKANAVAARDFIAPLCDNVKFVNPVICSIGWRVDPTDLYQKPVLLVNEDTLGKVIGKFAPKTALSAEDREMIIRGIMHSCYCMQ